MAIAFPCRSGERSGVLSLDDAGLDLDGRVVPWLDVDDVRYEAHALGFVLPDGEVLWARGLGTRADECGAVARELRGAARRPALTQSSAPLVETFLSRVATDADPALVDVLLFPHALVLEPRGGASTVVPLPLVREVDRTGHAFTLRLRGLDDVELRGLGARSDEFAMRLAEQREGLARATSAAFAQVDPALASLGAPDGWAVTSSQAAGAWPTLSTAWRAQGRATESAVLMDLAGVGGVRLGLWTEGGSVRMPFLLASVGAGSAARVAVEAVDADDRATFVFATDDVDRLNAALVLTAFRRDAIALPDEELGRWAVAVRTQPVVRWMRERLVARVVHDAAWPDRVRAALLS